MTARVSVIVCAREATDELRETWRSLGGQDGIGDSELLLADGSAHGDLDPGGEPLTFTRVHIPAGSMPALKGHALRVARADIVAFIDPGAVAAPGWVNAVHAGLATAHVTAPASAIGGEVHFAARPTSINQAAFLFEYGAFAPPLRSGVTSADLPGNNIAYRRADLLAVAGPVLASGFWKPFCHERLRASGRLLALDPRMRVRYQVEHRLTAFCARRFHYARCFGAMRQAGASATRRWLYTVFTPLVPLLLFARHVRRALGRPELRGLLPRALPSLLLICTAWGIGESLGCWFGSGRSCAEVY